MAKQGERLNEFMVSCFYAILRAEEKALANVPRGKLSIKEIHVIDAVFRARDKGENNFSTISAMLGITPSSLTTAYLTLEKKGYLTKEQDPTNKRVYHIMPTKLATAVYTAHQAWHERLVANVVNFLPQKELENLEETLQHLHTFISEHYK